MNIFLASGDRSFLIAQNVDVASGERMCSIPPTVHSGFDYELVISDVKKGGLEVRKGKYAVVKGYADPGKRMQDRSLGWKPTLRMQADDLKFIDIGALRTVGLHVDTVIDARETEWPFFVGLHCNDIDEWDHAYVTVDTVGVSQMRLKIPDSGLSKSTPAFCAIKTALFDGMVIASNKAFGRVSPP